MKLRQKFFSDADRISLPLLNKFTRIDLENFKLPVARYIITSTFQTFNDDNKGRAWLLARPQLPRPLYNQFERPSTIYFQSLKVRKYAFRHLIKWDDSNHVIHNSMGGFLETKTWQHHYYFRARYYFSSGAFLL